MELFSNRIQSPLGEMLLVTDNQGIVRALDFTNHKVRLHRELRERFDDVELREAVETEAVKTISGKLDRLLHGTISRHWTILRWLPMAAIFNDRSGRRSARSRPKDHQLR